MYYKPAGRNPSLGSWRHGPVEPRPGGSREARRKLRASPHSTLVLKGRRTTGRGANNFAAHVYHDVARRWGYTARARIESKSTTVRRTYFAAVHWGTGDKQHPSQQTRKRVCEPLPGKRCFFRGRRGKLLTRSLVGVVFYALASREGGSRWNAPATCRPNGKWRHKRSTARRRILVIGDGNVPRIAGELRKIWGNSVRVRHGFERRMTTDKLQHLLQKHSDGEGRNSQVVVVHQGIHDVLKGAQHGDIAQTIGQAVTPVLEREGRLAQDGIHYLASTTREVATQLAQRQTQSQTSADYRVECPSACRGEAVSNPRTSWNCEQDHYSPEGNRGRCAVRLGGNPPRTYPAGLLNDQGTGANLEHTTSFTGKEFGSADVGATPGDCPPYSDSMAGTQSQRKPRALSNGWGNGPPANDAAAPKVANANPPMSRKRRRRHHYERTNAKVTVGFLNLHGARMVAKWTELYKTLKEENIVLYGVAKTHLRELEEPPIDPEWQWVGCNRTGGCRKGGGVGVLWRSNTAWMPMKGPCVEHIWVSGNLLGESVLFGEVYLMVTSGAHDGNAKVLQCIAEDVKRWGADREVLLMGDFNGHIPATDGFFDYNGQLLLRCAEQLSLDIVNLRANCEGCFTWCARSSRSTIDYALVTAKLAARITQIHIDEEGQFSLGSDHNRIRPHVTSTEAWYVFAEQVIREDRRGV
ncbi:hypothetical protein HPB52_022410 [Rhipicephalus sanguineus]|uniref:Endonuclease/exonuclease/phosphatase domain-containing protein n=1 Tax=Rhipicephalus sanguineus TaxID=34632 RepID=A0A9D4Q444_RHISA|nr:hypothetical protein HPB52_022410 [Rhipicephalus sanguineus]